MVGGLASVGMVEGLVGVGTVGGVAFAALREGLVIGLAEGVTFETRKEGLAGGMAEGVTQRGLWRRGEPRMLVRDTEGGHGQGAEGRRGLGEGKGTVRRRQSGPMRGSHHR